MINIKKLKEKVVEVILVAVGIFIIYQLVRKLFGGSWQTESLVIALLIFNLGLTLKLSAKFEGHIGWHKGQSDKK